MNEKPPVQLGTILTAEDLLLEWQDSESEPGEASKHLQEEIFRNSHSKPESWLFELGFTPSHIALPESLNFWRNLAANFVHKLAMTPDLEDLREKAEIAPHNPELLDWIENAPLFHGQEHLSLERAKDCWNQLNRAYKKAVRHHTGTVESLLHGLKPDLELAGRVFFHLVENKKDAPEPFAFLATYSTHAGESGKTRHVPLKNALAEYRDNKAKLLELLSTVYKAARESDIISELIESGRIFHPLAFNQETALTFLKETPVYENAGIKCRIPNWWTTKSSQIGVSIKLGEKKPSHLGFNAILECSPKIRVGKEKITPEQAYALLEETSGLVLIKNKWVEVDQERLEKTLDVYEKARELVEGGLTMREAMRLLLNPKDTIGDLGEDTGVEFGDWLMEVTRKLADPSLVRETEPTESFNAELRPYQKQGVNWLALLDSLGFGACLADDMGLGKTIETLAFLSIIRNHTAEPSLLVLPASLIGNWCDEIQRFLPDLKTLIFHGSAMSTSEREEMGEAELNQYELVITTYGIVHRDEWLQEQEWHYVILDEAQAIKNPRTLQTRAVKKLNCHNRIVLTGTPVENRLADLWSIFDFLNPGLLGKPQEFKELVKGIQDSKDGYARLRRVVSPYILRRLKTDKSIINDLPEKVEMKSYADLSEKQVIIYKDLLEGLKYAIEEADGIQRRGLVLASLMKFKQICNHPDQYSGAGGYKETDSGKFKRLREICETIAEKHERTLVFTQFREIIEPLDNLLEKIFGKPGFTLHGGVPVNKRRKIVDEFQNSRNYVPYIVLSVRAAGVGLNLARANHVIHFDRWWNPAVENQATDRAFRIGQTRNVLVHKFVTKGTVEERIDQMIYEKKELSEQVISSSSDESWITEMNDKQLMDMFTLNR